MGGKTESPQGSDGPSGNFNEYGEARVILVRDEETCDRLQAELGRSSLVLTILESKGMEFDDVFLYNFLSSSPYSHKLSVLEELFKRRHHTGKVYFIKMINFSRVGCCVLTPFNSKDISPEDHLGLAGEAENGNISRLERGARLGSQHNASTYQGSHADWVKENIVSNQQPISLKRCS